MSQRHYTTKPNIQQSHMYESVITPQQYTRIPQPSSRGNPQPSRGPIDPREMKYYREQAESQLPRMSVKKAHQQQPLTKQRSSAKKATTAPRRQQQRTINEDSTLIPRPPQSIPQNKKPSAKKSTPRQQQQKNPSPASTTATKRKNSGKKKKNNKKKEDKKKLNQEGAEGIVTIFTNVLNDFMSGLADVFPDCKKLQTTMRMFSALKEDSEGRIMFIEKWYDTMSPNFELCRKRDFETLLRCDIGLIHDLDMCTKYEEMKDNPDSIETLWSFIDDLNEFSSIYNGQKNLGKNFTPTIQGNLDRLLSKLQRKMESGQLKDSDLNMYRLGKYVVRGAGEEDLMDIWKNKADIIKGIKSESMKQFDQVHSETGDEFGASQKESLKRVLETIEGMDENGFEFDDISNLSKQEMERMEAELRGNFSDDDDDNYDGDDSSDGDGIYNSSGSSDGDDDDGFF